MYEFMRYFYGHNPILLKMAKAWRNREALPWVLMDRLKQVMMNRRHRRLAMIGEASTVMNDGWIENPEGTACRVRIGARCLIRGHLFVPPHGGRIVMGDDGFVGPETRIWSAACVTIGHNVLISHQVNIMDNDSHSQDPVIRHLHFAAIRTGGHPVDAPDIAAAPISIGDHAWIGYGASILKGVTIGEGAIVAARSVVTRDVPPWTVVAGFPAQVVKDISALRYPAV